MKKLLILTGDLACGKSTFASILSEKYKINMFRKDDVKEILCDRIGFSDRNENRKLSVAAVEMMSYCFSELARLGRDVILEANFREDELVNLHDIAGKYGYDVLTLVFSADPDILFSRFINRIENQNRHPAHQSIGITDVNAFKAYLDDFRPQTIPGRVLPVCADDFSFIYDETLNDQIEAFLE